MTPTLETLDQTELVFEKSGERGFFRKGSPDSFFYVDKDGDRLRDKEALSRIKRLVLPPAWKDVWISSKKNSYLQATGTDSAGRKQYRYHIDWVKRRTNDKYFRLLEFGQSLAKARKRIEEDIRRKKFDERKVLAICIEVLQKTLIRIGNESYKRMYGSYGLSTLKDAHFIEKSGKACLNFVGKKGVIQSIGVNDSKLIRLIKRCKEIPGQELFQFYDDDGKRHAVDSGMINRYIQEICEGDFTAKDFRTWGGTLEAFRKLAEYDFHEKDLPTNRICVKVLDDVAEMLGNTRAVCRSSYVYPLLFEKYENGGLAKYLRLVRKTTTARPGRLERDEKLLLKFLSEQVTPK